MSKKITLDELKGMAGVTHHMGMPSVLGGADLVKFAKCVLKYYAESDTTETNTKNSD